MSPRSTWMGGERGWKGGRNWRAASKGPDRLKVASEGAFPVHVLPLEASAVALPAGNKHSEHWSDEGMSGWLSDCRPRSAGAQSAVLARGRSRGGRVVSRSRRPTASREVSGPRDCGSWGQGLESGCACVFKRARPMPGDCLSGFCSAQLP